MLPFVNFCIYIYIFSYLHIDFTTERTVQEPCIVNDNNTFKRINNERKISCSFAFYPWTFPIFYTYGTDALTLAHSSKYGIISDCSVETYERPIIKKTSRPQIDKYPCYFKWKSKNGAAIWKHFKVYTTCSRVFNDFFVQGNNI